MGWHLDGQILPGSEAPSELESLRTFGPSVVEEDDGTLRMWYSGHDGSTSRILEAVQRPGGPWERRGVSIDVVWSRTIARPRAAWGCSVETTIASRAG